MTRVIHKVILLLHLERQLCCLGIRVKLREDSGLTHILLLTRVCKCIGVIDVPGLVDLALLAMLEVDWRDLWAEDRGIRCIFCLCSIHLLVNSVILVLFVHVSDSLIQLDICRDR